MKLEACKPGAAVSFWVYMGDRYTATGRVANNALVFARILSVGRVWVTVETERGYRKRKRPEDLELAPEGEEYLEPRSPRLER